ncbi:MAG: shikimate dehydrogenase [Sneathiella sp.]|nr:shikimate dehydrogenase [Sneathiella sp.]
MIKMAGVMGYPISHSLSPRLHGYWIDKYDLDATYEPWAVKPEDLKETLKNLALDAPKKGGLFRGTNLTIPLKEAALPLVDILEASAKIIGAVNTVVVNEDGKLIGRNTDGIGFSDSLAEHTDIKKFEGGTALVLGAGGASKAVVYAILQMGFSRIYVTNRTQERAQELCTHIGDNAEVILWENRTKVLGEIDLLVNTTSLGMAEQPPLHMPLKGLKSNAVVTDIVYVPLETELLKEAKAAGNLTVDGLGMLLHQAKAGFEAWYGVKPQVDKNLRDFVLEGLKK